MISKELLSEVLGYEARYIQTVGTKLCFSCHIKGGSNINIYELAHKCKEWAYTKYKIILTSKLFDYQIKNIFDCYLETGEKSRENIRNFAHPDFISNTEPEAIFKACQWILDNKENK